MITFLILPIAIGVFSRIGGDALLYRSMFLEEINKDYVRTARSKGLSETAVLFRHVLRNASLPIITSTVAVLPMLFLGSLIMESFLAFRALEVLLSMRSMLRTSPLSEPWCSLVRCST